MYFKKEDLAGSLAGILLVLLCLVFVNLVPDPLEGRVELVLHPVHVLNGLILILQEVNVGSGFSGCWIFGLLSTHHSFSNWLVSRLINSGQAISSGSTILAGSDCLDASLLQSLLHGCSMEAREKSKGKSDGEHVRSN